jgi:hypothetical protein
VPWLKAGSRAFLAFGQHYALYIVETHKLANNPWLEWQRFTTAAFPGATTVFGAAWVNPGEFMGFILANLKGTIWTLLGFLKSFWTAAWRNAILFARRH